MKKSITFCFILLLLACKSFAQQAAEKYDVILKTAGDEMQGKITEINDDNVKFAYKGETLVYTIKKSDIFKIIFASGRTEVITTPKTSTSAPTQAALAQASVDSKNQVAILPFALIRDGKAGSEDMRAKIQTDCFANFAPKAVAMKFQDPNTTNAILFRNNINSETIKGHTMDELCHILGVEYVVSGVVTLNRTNSVTTGAGGANATTKKEDNKTNTNVFATSTSTSYDNYNTTIAMSIYDEKGTQVYSKDHQSFWPGQEAYKVTLTYLAKRTPIYGK